jgi:tRNA threonylcarbamoyladenosine biosynthesis protein TsaB
LAAKLLMAGPFHAISSTRSREMAKVRKEASAETIVTKRFLCWSKLVATEPAPSVITLAIDTCEPRGSVAVLRAGTAVALRRHEDNTDYSVWLLPAVERALAEAEIGMDQLDLLGVATGPGSFTGVRVGLTTVKAWAEVYGKPVIGVSRLEAMARTRKNWAGFLAASYNAQRGQLFSAVYSNINGQAARVGDEMVIAPGELVELVGSQAGEERVTWISLDPELITELEPWKRRVAKGDVMEVCSPDLAPSIGILAEERALRGEFSDPLALDANYVRRSDAEIFWRGPASHVR